MKKLTQNNVEIGISKANKAKLNHLKSWNTKQISIQIFL